MRAIHQRSTTDCRMGVSYIPWNCAERWPMHLRGQRECVWSFRVPRSGFILLSTSLSDAVVWPDDILKSNLGYLVLSLIIYWVSFAKKKDQTLRKPVDMQKRDKERQTERATERAIHQFFVNTVCLFLALMGLLLFLLLAFLKLMSRPIQLHTDQMTLTL